MIIAIHGFLGGPSDWGFWGNVDLGQRVELLTLPGHCGRDIQSSPLTQVYEDLDLAWKANQQQPIILLGYSLGARLALSFACDFPNKVSALCLESLSPGIVENDLRNIRLQEDREWAKVFLQQSMPEALERWYQPALWQSLKDRKKQLIELRLNHGHKNHQIAKAVEYFSHGVQPSRWDQLADLKVPLNLIVGELDQKYCVQAQKILKLKLNTSLEVVKGVGHNVHYEAPELYIQWLQSQIKNYF